MNQMAENKTYHDLEPNGQVQAGLKVHEVVDRLLGQDLKAKLKTFELVVSLAKAVKERSGRLLLVGGSVRDEAMGKTPKDFDVEIYRLPLEALKELASKFGKVKMVGEAFLVLKLTTKEGIDLDISLPRKDSRTGRGHKGFLVEEHPEMTIREAAKRRDFTMNSLAKDPLTGEIFDFFGGLNDIARRVLRVTDRERFPDDPLRALRAIQFCGRFEMGIDDDSKEIIRTLNQELKDLPPERIGEEWRKLLLKSRRPSFGLSAGLELGIFDQLHPELSALKKTQQEKRWHPEGDVFIHTLMVVDEAAKIARKENLSSDQRLKLLLSALCHDLGKPATTKVEAGLIRSPGHEPAGGPLAEQFCRSLAIDNKTTATVVKLVENHLAPALFYQQSSSGQEISDGAFRRLAKKIEPANFYLLNLLAFADHRGRGPFTDPKKPGQFLMPDDFPAGIWFMARVLGLGLEKKSAESLIRGKDLIALGLKPDKKFGEIIRLADDLRDNINLSREAVLEMIAKAGTSERATALLQEKLAGAGFGDDQSS